MPENLTFEHICVESAKSNFAKTVLILHEFEFNTNNTNTLLKKIIIQIWQGHLFRM